MAITAQNIAERLLKKVSGVADTNFPLTVRGIGEEAMSTYNVVTPNSIWVDAEKITVVPPVLAPGADNGIIRYYEKLALIRVDNGTDVAFKSPNGELKDAISGRFGFGYNFHIYGYTNNTIEIFKGDWFVDPEAGVLTFYDRTVAGIEAPVSGTQPPYITFYKYIGDKGLAVSGATSGLVVKAPVKVATASGSTAIPNYNVNTSGYTSFSSTIDGVSTFSIGDRVLIKNQTDTRQNGVFQFSGNTSTLVRGIDSDGQPIGEVGINDYVFVESGNTNIASSWVLDSTDAVNVDKIVVGQDTQTWTLFARSASYQSDNLALKLNGQTFSVALDGTTIHGSGLQQTVDGLRVTTALMETITGNTDAISTEVSLRTVADESVATSLSTTISTTMSTEVGTRTSVDVVLSSDLSTEIGTRSSVDVVLSNSISTGLSTEIGTRTSVDVVLSNALSTGLSTEVGTRTSVDVVLSNAISTTMSTEVGTRSSVDVVLSSDLSTEIGTRSSVDAVLSSAISTAGGGLSTETSLREVADTSLATSLSTSLSTEISTRTSVDNAISGALSTEVYTRTSADTSLATSISTTMSTEESIRTSADTSLETAISTGLSTEESIRSTISEAVSTEESNRTNADTSLETAISTVMSTEVSTRTSIDTVLSSAISNEISTRTSVDTVLSSAISTEVYTRTSADTSIGTYLNNLSGVTSQTAGSGLSYVEAEQTLNVNVDDWTIKIVSDELRTPLLWIQNNGKADVIITGTTGATNITITYLPVGQVSAYINGVEYNVTIGSASTDNPFWFNVTPVIGSVLNFSATIAGFGIDTTDQIMVKYHYIDVTP